VVDANEYATKADLALLEANLRGDIRTAFAELRTDMERIRTDMERMRTENRTDMERMRTDMERNSGTVAKAFSDHQRWVFSAILGQYALIVGLYGLIISRLH
jgi:hypothetical protein